MKNQKISVLSVLLCFLLLACTPQDETDLKQPTLRQARGLDETVLAQLQNRIAAGDYGHITSLLIIHNNTPVMEAYFSEGGPDRLQRIFSVTKSITSASIGIALEQGKIKSLDQKVLTYFPEYGQIAHRDARKEAITVENLLTMSGGWLWDEDSEAPNDVTELYQSSDWIKSILDREVVGEPGSHFVYNTGATLLLSRILERETEQSVEAFTADNLFKPLGISEWSWDKGPNELADTGKGLHLRSTDMAKFGQLYLNKGRWNGKQIVPEAWVTLSTQKHITVDQNFDYGYLWWRFHNESPVVDSLQTNDVYFALGYDCQFVFVIPHLNMVVVSTGQELGQECGIFDALKDYIFPAVIYQE